LKVGGLGPCGFPGSVTYACGRRNFPVMTLLISFV